MELQKTKNGRGRPPKMMLTPEQKAKKIADRQATLGRLASKRVSKAVKAVSLVGNLANYGPTEEQATKIINHIGNALNETAKRLRATSNKAQPVSFVL